MRTVEGFGSDVFPHPYHIPATPTPRRIGPLVVGIEFDGLGARRIPLRAQGFEAGANADAFSHDLPGDRGSLIVERVQDAKLQRIDSESDGEIVIELLLRDCHLRHAKSAKRAGRNNVGVDGTRQCPVVRNRIRPGSMHRNARRNRRPPRGIGAGIEIGGEIKRKQVCRPWLPRHGSACARDGAWSWHMMDSMRE